MTEIKKDELNETTITESEDEVIGINPDTFIDVSDDEPEVKLSHDIDYQEKLQGKQEDEPAEEDEEVAIPDEKSDSTGEIPEDPAVPADLPEEQPTASSNTHRSTPRNTSSNAQDERHKPVYIFEIGDTENNSESKTPEEIEYETWRELETFRRRGQILRSTVDRVYYDENLARVFVTTHYHGLMVNIPDTEFFEPSSMFTSDYYSTNMINANGRDERAVFASRMAEETRRYIENNKTDDSEPEISEEWKKRTEERVKERIIKERQASIQFKTAKYMLGAKIAFTITSAKRERRAEESYDEIASTSEYTYTIIGSRCAGMQGLRNYYFGGKGKTPQPNDIAEANVLRVTTTYVVVECCGIETRITPNDLSFKDYISDPTDKFHAGDKFKVVIRKIFEPTKDNPHYGLAVSRRLLGRKNSAESLRFVSKGMVSAGKIVAYSRKSDYYTVMLNPDGVICYVKSPSKGLRMFPGDGVFVQITSINHRTNNVYGAMVR